MPSKFSRRTLLTAGASVLAAAGIWPLWTTVFGSSVDAARSRQKPIDPAIPYLCCANRGRIPYSLGQPNEPGTIRAETRKLFKIGGAAQADLKLGYSGFAVLSDGELRGQESLPGNDQRIEVAIEIPGAPVSVVRCLFNGDQAGVIRDGIDLYFTDPVYPYQFGLDEFASGTMFYIRELRQVSPGERFTRYGKLSRLPGESTIFSNGTGPSQVDATEILRVSDTKDRNCCFGPSVIVGRAIGTPDIAILAMGDSIVNGSNDEAFGGSSDGSDGKGGWFTRGVLNVNGRAIPHSLMAFNGTGIYELIEKTGNGMQRRSAMFAYFTHAIENYGTNDFGDLHRSADNVVGNRKRLWIALRAPRSSIRHITAIPIIPRTGSINGFANVSGQFPKPGFESGSDFRSRVNSALQASIGQENGIDALFDLDAIFTDPDRSDVWTAVQNKVITNDGTHPTPAGAGLAAIAFQDYVKLLV